ncbi:MAG: hypothetical protein GAK30_01953 [Paracidovorax wautersii]|uniref:Uncharacterized protein n=1 Tax=Paracidovorax wautersii TaxID=1177982 RepID=A0A7V8FP33_9BURK|nr:MAG: hypothetical protein GAK30_01953 [Paracidovorax wautersii]
MNRFFVLALAALAAGLPAHAQVSVPGPSGALVYADGGNGRYQSLTFRRADGRVLSAFDDGLEFAYDPRHDADKLSPDRRYTFVSFSAQGEDGTAASSEYLCAFVRMDDGCVVHVAQGSVCGGQWQPPHRWTHADGRRAEPVTDHPPKMAEIVAAYASGHKDGSQVSQPRVLAYLAEGTSFDNLLACDPPGADNRNSYSKMLALLKADRDTQNAARLRAALKAGPRPAATHAVPDSPSATRKEVLDFLGSPRP